MADEQHDVNGASERVRHLVAALAKLVAALPVKANAAVDRSSVWLRVYEDAHVGALAAMLGLPSPERVTFDGSTWLTTPTSYVDGLEVKLSGPHAPAVDASAAIDKERVEAALEQAQAAIAGASS